VSLSFSFPTKSFVCIFHISHACFIPLSPHPLLIPIIINIWQSASYESLQYTCLHLFVTSSFLFFSASCSHTLNLTCILLLGLETKFHIHVKQHVKLYFTCFNLAVFNLWSGGPRRLLRGSATV
jgi:hypothetical protein